MDDIRIIREYIKGYNSNFNQNNFKIISSNGNNKLFYNSDFICYLNNLDQDMFGIIINSLKNYKELSDNKANHCIICITNSNEHLIEYIVRQMIGLKIFQIIIMAPSNQYINLGIQYNINYLTSSTNDYVNMIQTGLTYIRNSQITSNNVYIINTETIVNTNTIKQTINQFTQAYRFAAPDNMKYIDLTNGNIVLKQVTIGEKNKNKLFLTNWFMISKIFLNTVNWKLFADKANIYDLLEMYIQKYNVKIMYVSNITLCFGYIPHTKIPLPIKINKYEPIEYQSLTTFISVNKTAPYYELLNKHMDEISKTIIPKNEPIKETIITIPNNKVDSGSKLMIDKIYILTHQPETKLNLDLNKTDYALLHHNNEFDNHISAIKDAIKLKLDSIIIIDETLLNKRVIHELKQERLFSVVWNMIFLIHSHTKFNLIKLSNNDRTVYDIKNFSYCIHHTIFNDYLNALEMHKNIYDSIFNFQKNKYIYVAKDEFNSQLLIETKKRNYDMDVLNKRKLLDQSGLIIDNSKIKFNGKIFNENKIIQSLWIGDNLSLAEILCITSFMYQGHEFHLYVYNEVTNVPTGCIVKNANDIVPQSLFTNEIIFKYKLLYDKGNYWVDIGFICLQFLYFTEKYLFIYDTTFSVPNAGIIKCQKGSDIMKYCYEMCRMTQLKDIGNKLLDNGVKKYILANYVKPWYYFCPVNYEDLNKIITPSNLNIDKSWYSLYICNEFFTENKLDKNKFYYGSLFCHLINKYCKEYVSHEIFNLELEYGKYNRSCVFFYWMPKDEKLVNSVENGLNRIENIYDINKCYIHKEYATANNDRIDQFVTSDIYIYMFLRLLEFGIIDNLHIVFGIAPNDKYVYNNEPLFSNGNYYNFNDNIHLWKLNDLNSLLSFANAKVYFYKGYGNYEHLYSMMTAISPHSIFMRYLATALPYTLSNKNEIIIDDTLVETYANNMICREKVKDFDSYFKKYYTNYDLLYIDTEEKAKHYKKLFTNTKLFLPFKKYSLMQYKETERIYDLMFCASDSHPSKNWDIMYDFLSYCNKNKKDLSILIITPDITDKRLQKYQSFASVKTILRRGLTSMEMNEMYNQCKCLMITFGRDANPRVISESLNCGCYNIVLDILSDGKDLIKNNPTLGTVIHTSNVFYVDSYKSVSCTLTPDNCEQIYNLIKKTHQHKKISESFNKLYSEKTVTYDLYQYIQETETHKQRLIITLATDTYANNVNYLLASIKNTNPNQMVIIYYINWSDLLLNNFKLHYPNYYFEEIKLDEYTKGDIIKLKVQVQKKAYFIYKLPFIWIDADSIVLKSLDQLFDKLKQYNLICYYRPEENYYMKFAVGVIGFGRSADLKLQQLNEKFITSYYDNSLITEGYNNWFYDQTSLYDTYLIYEKDINLYELKEHEHSINDTPDTIVYSRRTNNKTHLSEILTLKNIIVPNIDFSGVELKYK